MKKNLTKFTLRQVLLLEVHVNSSPQVAVIRKIGLLIRKSEGVIRKNDVVIRSSP